MVAAAVVSPPLQVAAKNGDRVTIIGALKRVLLLLPLSLLLLLPLPLLLLLLLLLLLVLAATDVAQDRPRRRRMHALPASRIYLFSCSLTPAPVTST